MTVMTRRVFAALAACACLPGAAASQTPAEGSGKFVCPPCGCSNDGKVFDKPGVCPDPDCGMALIAAPAEPKPPAGASAL